MILKSFVILNQNQICGIQNSGNFGIRSTWRRKAVIYLEYLEDDVESFVISNQNLICDKQNGKL